MPKVRAGLLVAGLLGRVWLVAAAIILARYAGGKDDGIMAAVLVLAAFTVYLAMSFITADSPVAERLARAGQAEHLMSARPIDVQGPAPARPARASAGSTDASSSAGAAADLARRDRRARR